MKAAEQKYDPVLSYDPAEFMARIWGNKPEQLEEGKEVKKSKNDVNVAFEEEDESDEDEEKAGSRRPSHISQEDWDGIQFFKDTLRNLDAYLNQPLAETVKLQTLIALYENVAARLDNQARKCNLTLEQALEIKRTKDSLTEN
jgi:hypothetical protein